VGLLVLYVWMLLSMKRRDAPETPEERVRAVQPPADGAVAAVARHVAEGRSTWAKPRLNGLPVVAESDRVHVVVRPAEQVARA
jgi:hypothetical protein